MPSPTFTLVETYDLPAVRLPVVHADFYRLEHPREAAELGLDDYREGAVLLAEWPQRAGGFAGEPGCLAITLEIADGGRKASKGPKLAGSKRSDEFIVDRIKRGKPGRMPAFGSFSDEQIQQILVYIRSLEP